MTTIANPNQLLIVDELAAELQVPVGSVRRWRRYGAGPDGTRVGKHIRYRRRDIDRWLDANRDQPRQFEVPGTSGRRWLRSP